MTEPLTAPQLGVGAVVRRGAAVLLVKRAQAPYENEWAVPGGRVRLGESLSVAAEREVREETGVTIKAGEPVYTFEHIERRSDESIRFHYVVVDVEGHYVSGKPRPADDAAEAAWVPFAQLDQLEVNSVTLGLVRRLFPDAFGGEGTT